MHEEIQFHVKAYMDGTIDRETLHNVIDEITENYI